MPTDLVVCRECGFASAKLYRHIACHGLTAKTYQEKHGPDAPLRSVENALRQKVSREVRLGRTEAAEALDALWAGKVLGEDFVECMECGYRAENLTGHISSSHPDYRERHPNAQVVASGSAVRDKTLLKGRPLSAETRERMSRNAGRWNAGLTKETDERVANHSRKMQGKVSWAKGLNRDDPRVARIITKLRTYAGDRRPWSEKLKANLRPEDFDPYLDEHGRVDTHAAGEGLGYSLPTLLLYMRQAGLSASDKHIRALAEARTIRLEREVLMKYALANGKVSIGAAMAGLGHAFATIVRECERHGLPTFHRRIRQTLCLDAVSKALGGVPYVQEWNQRKFTNARTGAMFKFDGFYAEKNLIVEFHGAQHYVFPNAYMRDESYRPLWEAMLWRDAEKERLATAAGIRYLVVREDEPYTDVDWLKARLSALFGQVDQ